MLFDWELAADLGHSLGLSSVDADTAKAVIKEFAARKYWRKRARPARMAFIVRAEVRYDDARGMGIRTKVIP
jgi:hypothetical protein